MISNRFSNMLPEREKNPNWQLRQGGVPTVVTQHFT
jgi:hypothetical protein